MNKLPRTPKAGNRKTIKSPVGEVRSSMGKKYEVGDKKGKSLIPSGYLKSPNLGMWISSWQSQKKSIRDIRKVHTKWNGKEGNT